MRLNPCEADAEWHVSCCYKTQEVLRSAQIYHSSKAARSILPVSSVQMACKNLFKPWKSCNPVPLPFHLIRVSLFLSTGPATACSYQQGFVISLYLAPSHYTCHGGVRLGGRKNFPKLLVQTSPDLFIFLPRELLLSLFIKLWALLLRRTISGKCNVW